METAFNRPAFGNENFLISPKFWYLSQKGAIVIESQISQI